MSNSINSVKLVIKTIFNKTTWHELIAIWKENQSLIGLGTPFIETRLGFFDPQIMIESE